MRGGLVKEGLMREGRSEGKAVERKDWVKERLLREGVSEGKAVDRRMSEGRTVERKALVNEG
jgi:hypothetical protein